MKIIKYLSYYVLTALYSIFIGLVAWSYLYIVNLVLHCLWVGEEGHIGFMYQHKYLIFPFIIIGSMLLAYTYNRYEVIPRPGIEYAKEYKLTNKVKYNDFIKVYILAMIPLFLGASVGPEAAVIGLFFMLSSYLGDKTDKIESKLNVSIINNKQDKFIDTIKKNPLYLLKLITVYFFVSYTVFHMLAIDKFPSFNVFLQPVELNSYFELIEMIPLLFIGYILAKFYKITEHPIEHFFSNINNQYIKMLITGIILSLAAYYAPILIMSGEATLHILVEHPVLTSGISLIILSLLKILLTHICISGDLKGGHIFPIIYTSFLMGAGLSIIFNLDFTLAIAAITTGMTLTIFSNYIAIFLLLALFFPIKLLSLIFIMVLLYGERKSAVENRNEL